MAKKMPQPHINSRYLSPFPSLPLGSLPADPRFMTTTNHQVMGAREGAIKGTLIAGALVSFANWRSAPVSLPCPRVRRRSTVFTLCIVSDRIQVSPRPTTNSRRQSLPRLVSLSPPSLPSSPSLPAHGPALSAQQFRTARMGGKRTEIDARVSKCDEHLQMGNDRGHGHSRRSLSAGMGARA